MWWPFVCEVRYGGKSLVEGKSQRRPCRSEVRGKGEMERSYMANYLSHVFSPLLRHPHTSMHSAMLVIRLDL